MKIPCGNDIKIKCPYCKRKHHWWNTYWIKSEAGHWELRCLICHDTIIVADKHITFKQWLFKKLTF